MPLISTKPPTECLQAFEAGLLYIVQLGRVPPGLAVNPDPQRIFHLNADDLAGDFHLPTIARPTGWRYFAGDSLGEVVAGDVSATSPPVLTHLCYGTTAQAALRVFLALAGLPEVNATGFEARLLRIPGALVEGFWLKPPADGNGLLIPCGRMTRDTQRWSNPLPIDDFLRNNLRPLAKQTSAFQAARSGSATD
jgi:hypothetical protein